MRKSTINYLESELRDYPNYNKHVAQLRNEILNPWTPSDENIGGGRSNTNVSTVERTVTRLTTDKRLLQLDRMMNAIERVYNESTEQQKEFMELYYFQKQRKYTVLGIADNLCISKTVLYEYKKDVLKRLADELGMMY